MHRTLAALAPLALGLVAALPAAAEQHVAVGQNVTSAPGITAETLDSSGRTIIGQSYAYPEGKAVVTSAIIVVPPGVETGWHTHAVPLFGYILEGTLTVDYGPNGIRNYGPGTGFMEAFETPHNGMNNGDVTVRILTVYAGAEGVENATSVEH